MTTEKRYASLEDILSKEAADLRAQNQGEFETERLGVLPFTAISYPEFSQIKKDCVKHVPNGTGGMEAEVDDDKMMVRVVIRAVDKDDRSSFTFANKELLKKLGVTTADEAVSVLLLPGEILRFATAVQNSSGFGEKAKKEAKDAVKNS
jgi:hypothetical protein